MKNKIGNYLKFLAKIILSAAALYFVFSKIQVDDVISIYRQSNFILLFLAMLLFISSKIIAAFRLNSFFNSLTLTLNHFTNLKLYLLGMFYNLFLPGGIGGDGYKIFVLNKSYQIKARKIFWAILLDRISGLIILLILATVFFVLSKINIPYKFYLLLIIPLPFLLFYWVFNRFFPQFIGIYKSVNVYSFFVQSLQIASAYLILLAIGTTDNTVEYLFLFMLSSIVATLPITIGGVGSRELTLLFGAQFLLLDQSSAVALSLMFYLITLFVSFWGIIYSIYPKGIQLKKR